MFGLRLPLVTSLIAEGFLLIAVLLGTLYLLAPHVTLRITTGPAGSNAQRVISTFISVLHPRIRFVTVPVPDLEASSKALEDGKVDIAVVRSDIRPPANGQTLVILRRDVIAIVLPANSRELRTSRGSRERPSPFRRGRCKRRIPRRSTKFSAIIMSRQRGLSVNF